MTRDDAVVAAIIGRPQGCPPADLSTFWPRFRATAPAHLRLGFQAAAIAIDAAALTRHRRRLASLDPDTREALVEQLAAGPAAPLIEVAKVVACLAWFADPAVQAWARQ